MAQIRNHYANLKQKHPHIRYDDDRLRKLATLDVARVYIGQNEFEGYIALTLNGIQDVVLECPKWGNAIYIVKRDWQRLSKLTKRELLHRYPGLVRRIVHSGDWFGRLRNALVNARASDAADWQRRP